MEIVGLYREVIKNLQALPSGQYRGLCPFHDDHNPSWSGNSVGFWKCHACGKKGNAYQLAKWMGLDPTPFINNSKKISPTYSGKMLLNLYDKRNTDNSKEKLDSPQIIEPELYEPAHQYFIENSGEVNMNPNWRIDVVEKLKIGWDDKNGCFVFPVFDVNGDVISVWYHKPANFFTNGAKNTIYPLHLLQGYDPEKPIIICEGMKDTCTMLSLNAQAICFTNGANSIPEDLSPLRPFKKILIIYDKDKAGEEGQKKVAQHLSMVFPETNVYQLDWNLINNTLPKGYDVSDAAAGILLQIPKALREYNPVIGGFEILDGDFILKSEPAPFEWVVERLVVKGQRNIIAGTKKANKSFLSLMIALSVASGRKEVLGYKINRPMKVLYISTEGGKDSIQRRIKAITKGLSCESFDGMLKVTGDKAITDLYERNYLEDLIKWYVPGLVIIDNAYSSSTKNFSKNEVVRQVEQKLDDLIAMYGFTLLLVIHFNKGSVEGGLVLDKMQGASAWQNWIENAVLIARSNHPDGHYLRLVKFEGVRDSDFSDEYFGLRFNPDKLILEMVGIMPDWSKHLTDKKKLSRMYEALRQMPKQFFTAQWIDKVVIEWKKNDKCVSRQTAQNWLNSLRQAGAIVKLNKGFWEKTDTAIIIEED